jgi:hypothetical protein
VRGFVICHDWCCDVCIVHPLRAQFGAIKEFVTRHPKAFVIDGTDKVTLAAGAVVRPITSMGFVTRSLSPSFSCFHDF